jgi:pimeloyl-ACP methyl ester carboxylesterase
MALRFGPEHPEATYVSHAYPEHQIDLGEVTMNYAVVGDETSPALLLIPGQTESWWGYEKALEHLAEHFRAYAVDLRGQGRSSRTPGRYTLDNMGNDLVRFIDGVIGRPTVVSGLSSGGVLTAWLSAYAKPGQLRGAHYEDPPLFASEVNTSCGQSIRQGPVGSMFALFAKHLGDQWSVGDWDGLRAAGGLFPEEPPQNLKEYDPEWARAFCTGTVAASCDHARMLAGVKVPVLFTHHRRHVDASTGLLMGAIADVQAARARELVTGAGNRFDYQSHPTIGHSMHGEDPALFSRILVEWEATLPPH